MQTLMSTLREAGPLRWMLLAFTLALVLMAPFAFLAPAHGGWRLLATQITPALVPPMFFVYPLDMTMCRVKMDGADDDTRGYFRRMIKLNVGQMVLLMLAWAPFFFTLLR